MTSGTGERRGAELRESSPPAPQRQSRAPGSGRVGVRELAGKRRQTWGLPQEKMAVDNVPVPVPQDGARRRLGKAAVLWWHRGTTSAPADPV